MKTKFMIITLAALAIVALPVLSANQAMACGSKTTASADEAAVKNASATDGGCDSKVNATAAVATENVDAKVTAVGSGCSAKAASAEGCASKANATTASAKEGTCTKSASASLADAEGKTCTVSQDDCVAWLMANKGMTKDQALAAFEHCSESKSAAVKGIELAQAKDEAVVAPAAAEQPNN